MKSGSQKVADHVARTFEESAAPGDEQDHKREELQGGQQFPASGKLALPPALLEFSLGRFFGALALVRHVFLPIYRIQNSIQYRERDRAGALEDRRIRRQHAGQKGQGGQHLDGKGERENLQLRVQPAEHRERYIQQDQ